MLSGTGRRRPTPGKAPPINESMIDLMNYFIYLRLKYPRFAKILAQARFQLLCENKNRFELRE